MRQAVLQKRSELIHIDHDIHIGVSFHTIFSLHTGGTQVSGWKGLSEKTSEWVSEWVSEKEIERVKQSTESSIK